MTAALSPDELCTGAARALSGEAALHLRAGRLYLGERRFVAGAPHLQLDAPAPPLPALRGARDAAAARLAASDAALHARLRPAPGLSRAVFDLLEQLRAESRVPDTLAGMQANLRLRFADWSRAFHGAGLTADAVGLLLYTVAQVARTRLVGEPPLEEIEGVIEHTRAGLAAATGRHWQAMRRALADQAAFAVPAAALADWVAAEVAAARDDEGAGAAAPRARAALVWLADPDEADDPAAPAPQSGRSRWLDGDAGGYRVYTRRHDRELAAATQLRAEQLKAFRRDLDAHLEPLAQAPAALARRFHAHLARPQPDGWRHGLEEGRIDGRRLAALVSSPGERRIFRQPGRRLAADVAVTLLVDCSGSMKRHALPVAMLADVLLRALDSAGARTELLGYTTGAWNGGRARAEWLAAGRPPHPGRLNELCHLVFKDAERPWRRARTDVAALLRTELYREGIDGEAVDWACGRLAAQPVARRILAVLCDGSPMDSATHQANDPHYLEHHLQQVVERQRRRGIELVGLGVGLDMSAWFRDALAIDLAQPIDADLLERIADAIAAPKRPAPGRR